MSKPAKPAADPYLEQVRAAFTDLEWGWIIKDENCRNVIDGRDLLATLFYLRYRLPRKLRPKTAFWADVS